MQTFPVDIDAEQIVRWIMAEQSAAPMSFRVSARRTMEARELPARRELHLGDEEREELSEIATVATLEIAPVRASDGWLLTVVVEDELGPRVSDRSTTTEAEQEIGLGAFYAEFIRPGRGTANVFAETESGAGEARVTQLLEKIETNRHAPDRSASKGA